MLQLHRSVKLTGTLRKPPTQDTARSAASLEPAQAAARCCPTEVKMSKKITVKGSTWDVESVDEDARVVTVVGGQEIVVSDKTLAEVVAAMKSRIRRSLE